MRAAGGSRERAPWQGQVQRVREWYEPHLERIYDAAQVRAGDLDQLERIVAAVRDARAASSRSWRSIRRRRPATSRATPLLDEDYLMLSTVHSAKGQEWDAVYVLNVADGNFPSRVRHRPRRADRGGAAAAVRRDDAREEATCT